MMNNKIKATAMDSVVELSPKIKRSRSTFNLPIKNYTSFNVGELVPIDFTEVLPGDTFNVNLNTFIRLTSTCKRPPMDSLHMDIYAFFIPYRFLDDAWVNIQGENAAPWAVTPGSCSGMELPDNDSIEAGSLLNHLGFPVVTIDDDFPSGGTYFNIYPVYAYFKIWNDWFRDENLQNEIPIDTTNGSYSVKADIYAPYFNYINKKGSLMKVAKYHDVFTSALPAPQKGPAVSLLKAEGKAPVGFIAPNTVASTNTNYVYATTGGDSTTAGVFKQIEAYGTDIGQKGIIADVSQAYVTTINELRLAFQLQKAYELDARSGTRYTEALEARFGTKNPDLRLGRTELLGHYRFDLNMAELSSTTNAGTSGATIGDLKGSSYINGVGAGSSKTANGQHICVKSFLEHGLFMIVGAVRPDLTYQQGLDKFWRKKERWDFYEPIFSNIGEVPIMKSELYFQKIAAEDTASDAWDVDSVFGYQEAWYEYRYKQSHISGCLASDSNEGFDIFHYGLDFLQSPTLGQSFLVQSPVAVDRTLAFNSNAVDNFIAQFQGVIKATRVMPLFSVPGLIDHF